MIFITFPRMIKKIAEVYYSEFFICTEPGLEALDDFLEDIESTAPLKNNDNFYLLRTFRSGIFI